MANLVVKANIQVGFVRYSPGDILPAEHPLANAWVKSDAAVWLEETASTRPTAKRATAEPGLPGLTSGGELTGDEYVGKIPSTKERKRR